MQRRYVIVLGLLLLFPAGCFLNPYSSEFKCPKTESGQCVSVSDAYEESLKAASAPDRPDRVKNGGPVQDKEVYKRGLFRKLAGLIKEPSTPLVVPPTVMRGLVLTYIGDENELYSYQYVYFFVDDPSWIFGDYLNSGIEGDQK